MCIFVLFVSKREKNKKIVGKKKKKRGEATRTRGKEEEAHASWENTKEKHSFSLSFSLSPSPSPFSAVQELAVSRRRASFGLVLESWVVDGEMKAKRFLPFKKKKKNREGERER